MKKNYIYQMLFQVISLIAPFITTPYVSRVLNADLLGNYNYVLSYATYFVLAATLGMTTYGQREIAAIGNQPVKRTALFNELLTLRSISYGIAITAYICVFCLRGDNVVLNRIFVIHLLASFLDISWFFQGVENFKATVTRGSLVKIAGVILTFVLVKKTTHFYIYVVIIIATNLIGNVMLWKYISKYLIVKELRPSLQRVRVHLSQSMQLFIPQMAIQVYAVLDKTVLGLMQGNADVGYYSQSEKIVKMALAMLTAMGTVLMPRISSLYASEEGENAKQQIEKAFAVVAFLAVPMMVGMMIVAPEFIPFFLGKGYNPSVLVMQILALLCIPMGIAGITGPAVLIASKMNKQYTASVIMGAIVNLTLNVLLIPHYGAAGAAVATVLAESSVTLVQCYCVREKISIQSLFTQLVKSFATTLPMAVILLLLKYMMKWSGAYSIVLAAIGVIVYLLTCLICNNTLLKSMVSIFKR